MYAGRVIEEGSVDELFDHTRHPYTMGLLRSVPRLGETVPVKLEEIPGAPPDMRLDVGHCAFAPRCPFADHASFTARPELEESERPGAPRRLLALA